MELYEMSPTLPIIVFFLQEILVSFPLEPNHIALYRSKEDLAEFAHEPDAERESMRFAYADLHQEMLRDFSKFGFARMLVELKQYKMMSIGETIYYIEIKSFNILKNEREILRSMEEIYRESEFASQVEGLKLKVSTEFLRKRSHYIENPRLELEDQPNDD